MTYSLSLSDNREAIEPVIGSSITRVDVSKLGLLVEFESKKLIVYDAAAYCCENRYLEKDGDDLDYYIGSKFLDIRLASVKNVFEDYDTCHDIQFVELVTSVGILTLSAHNEHNGYYSGFSICASVQEKTNPWAV